MAELNITTIPAPRVPFIDERTGLMAREWYRFFLNMFVLTGSGSNATTLDELQIGPPTQPDIGVTSVTGTAPVVSSGGTAPAISMAAATTLVNGYLTSTDWNTFNNKGVGSVTSVSVVSANGLAGTVATATTTPAVTLSTTVTGILKGNGTAISAATSGTDYAPATSGTSILYGSGAGGFSNVAIGTGVAFAGGTLSATGSGGTVTSVTGTAPVVSSGGVTPAISMAAATTSVNGYLTSTDWTTFNNKVTSVSGTAGQITSTGGTTPVIDLVSGIATAGTTGSASLIPVVTIDTYGRVTTITTAANPQGTVTSVTGTAPVVSSGGATPAISMAAATTSVNGYLTSTDWTTFNGKQAALVSGTNIKTVNGTTLLGAGDLGTITYAYGGTGLTSYTAGDIIYASAANTVAKLAIGTTGQRLVVAAGLPSWATDTTVGTVTSVAQSFTGGLISVAGSPITTSGTLALTVAGTSGGVPYFSSASTWATSAALAANALVIGGGAGAAPATTTTGTGVVTALGVNTGSAGAVVVNGGALGTPSSGTVTNLTGTASININGTVGATTPAAGAFTTLSATGLITGSLDQVIGFKNKIIGGDFTVNPWQRGTNFAAIATATYFADRWLNTNTTTAVITASRAVDAPTAAQAGIFTQNCISIAVTTADTAIAAGDLVLIRHFIEGTNAASFGFGQTGSRNVTVSFWVKGTKTGIHCVSITNSAQDRAYVAEYTIVTTNTWEYKNITIPVDTTGTWLYDTGIGLRLSFALMSGTTYQTTANAWAAGALFATANQVNAMDNTSNVFKIALVQLEAGSVATSFDVRSVGTELSLCQRYYYRDTPPATGLTVGGNGTCISATQANVNCEFPVPMRGRPTALEQSGTATDYSVGDIGAIACSAVPAFANASVYRSIVTITVASGLTLGFAMRLRAANGTAGFLGWSAEL